MPDGSPGLTAAGRVIQHLDRCKRLPKVASVRSWKDSFTSDCWQREVRQTTGARWYRPSGGWSLSMVLSTRGLLNMLSLAFLCRGKACGTCSSSKVVQYFFLGTEGQL